MINVGVCCLKDLKYRWQTVDAKSVNVKDESTEKQWWGGREGSFCYHYNSNDNEVQVKF